MNERDPVIYIDCTSTFLGGLNTGVQRVVRALISETEIFSDITQLICIPISYQFNGFYTLDDAGNMTLATCNDFEPVEFRFRDIYLCPDAFWSHGITAWYDYFRDRGVTIATVIHDLIPLFNSEFFAVRDIRHFESALQTVVQKSDLLLTISHSTRHDLINYCLAKGLPFEEERCRVIPLAPALQASREDIDPRRLPADPFFLMVGTVEPRRGYTEAITEYQRYWTAGGEASLLIIGKQGAVADAVSESILHAGSKVTWLTDASDAELMAAYRHALAVVCPSRSEGYGMPVAEGLVYNGLVLANRLPVFGEFAGSLPYYFELDRAGDLARLLAAAPSLARMRQTPDMGNWRDSARVLATELTRFSKVHGHHQAIEITRNSEEAIRWSNWLINGHICNQEEVSSWLKFDTVSAMFNALQYEQRVPEAALTGNAIRWLQLAINQRLGISEEEIAWWRQRCNSVAVLRHALMAEHCRLEAPVSEFFVRAALVALTGLTEPTPEECAAWLEGCRTNGDFLVKYRRNSYLNH